MRFAGSSSDTEYTGEFDGGGGPEKFRPPLRRQREVQGRLFLSPVESILLQYRMEEEICTQLEITMQE